MDGALNEIILTLRSDPGNLDAPSVIAEVGSRLIGE